MPCASPDQLLRLVAPSPKPARSSVTRPGILAPRPVAMGPPEKKKPTDRELGIILREITGRMPGMPHNDGEVRIAKTTYNGADRFELTWGNEANTRRKLWYRNWRHALAAAKWANASWMPPRARPAFTFNDAADKWIKLERTAYQGEGPRSRRDDLLY